MEVNALYQMFASASLAGMGPPAVQVKSKIFSINRSVERNFKFNNALKTHTPNIKLI